MMIYLDNAATTACAPEVVESMIPLFRDDFANASSVDHLPGSRARRAVDEARESIAALVGARSEDVIFTSGSTEANNLALSGSYRLLTTALEHPSILDPFSWRKRQDDVLIPTDQNGLVNLSDLKERLSVKTPTLVSIIATNNETGTEQDIDALLEVAREAGALLHFDATQAVGTRTFDVRKNGIAGLSISAHKIYGPKGVGALVAGPNLRRAIAPIMRGGGHERGFRSGTLNVPGIVGFGVAARLARTELLKRRENLTHLRIHFLASLRGRLGSDSVAETVSASKTSPHILSVRLAGINGRALLAKVAQDVAFSLGSACATNKSEPSHVLRALGFEKRAIDETIRISFSAEQLIDEVERAATIISDGAEALSGYSISA